MMVSSLKCLMLIYIYHDTGYSIFVVVGDIPVSEADRKMMAALHAPKTGFDTPGHMLGYSDINYDTQLAMAISASLNEGQYSKCIFKASDKIFDMLIKRK